MLPVRQRAAKSFPRYLRVVADYSRTAKVGGDAPAGMEPVALVARIGDREVARHLLSAGTITVGSGSKNPLVVDHPTVSRTHLKIELVPGGVLVTDQGSTNGTHYNGARVTEVKVPVGAVLVIGSAELRVEPAIAPQTEKLGRLVSRSAGMRGAIKQLAKAAPTDVTILLEGETGVGKEIAARAVHEASARASGPFQVVDCGSLPRDLAAAELFGHVKGAFTGAEKDRAGAVERSNGGTLFLDEIGELPLDLQPLLLRVLERREFRRVGATDYKPVDVRILAATNRDLDLEVDDGRFRRDLLHRLSVVRVRLSPLRERPDDLPMLARTILDDLGPQGSSISLSPETLVALQAYRWPGNIRELRNFLERAIALGSGPIDPSLLGLPSVPDKPDYKEARSRAIESFEKDFIESLLRRYEGNVSRAAKEAGIDRVYLYKLIKKHGVVTKGD